MMGKVHYSAKSTLYFRCEFEVAPLFLYYFSASQLL